jgi:hypothetical protein
VLNTETKTSHQIHPDQIVGPQSVIHPCLDWVSGQLIVGVNLKQGGTGVLSSTQGLVRLDGLGAICEQGSKFSGAVSQKVAQAFVEYLEAPQEQKIPADGKKLLEDLSAYLKRFMVFPEPWFPEVLASWILGTYMFPIFQTYPYLWITSARPGCGKSLLGGIVANLSFNGEFLVAPTEAQLFHLPESSRGVQVWDEVECDEETDKKRFNTMRPVLLNGYRNGGTVPRQKGQHYEKSVRFHVFCPRVLIGLTKLPEPALQRTIQVRLIGRTEEQKVEHYVGSNLIEEERDLKERCLLCSLKVAGEVNDAYQNDNLRKELEILVGPGRASDDIWLPVFAVASAATKREQDVVGMLKTAARELAPSSTKSPDKVSIPVHVEVPSTTPNGSGQEPSMIARVALNVLESSGPLTPEALAKQVGYIHGCPVTAQSLSKNLSRMGIRSAKKKGSRVFSFDSRTAAVSRKLGFSGAGQQGQEVGKKREIEAAF